MNQQIEILTVGHSNQSIESFIALLARHQVTAVADVRSQPFSRYTTQFNKDELSTSLREVGVSYVFLGRELGARSSDPDCYVDGRVQYERLAKSDLFRAGIERVVEGARRERIALMCTEKDPLDCHRTVLVARQLVDAGVEVSHILADGSLEPHTAAMGRLLAALGMAPSLFESHDEQVESALGEQERRIAYVDPTLAPQAHEEAS